jgi:hypothetical protein
MGWRNPRHAGPGAGGAEIPAAGCTAVAEGKGEEADQWAPVAREERDRGENGHAALAEERGRLGRRGPCGEGKEERGLRGKGGSWAAVAHAGEGEEKEARGGELGCWALLSLLLPFFFLSTLKPFKPFHLNSNKFEFKPNTNKTMHQHECTSKLTYNKF